MTSITFKPLNLRILLMAMQTWLGNIRPFDQKCLDESLIWHLLAISNNIKVTD